ncbi:MAG: DUF5615 family PIN-like protein [Planctomycetota bacterium]|nr:DUF5615 family PIN-like protein [Planctomycetota bacterium]MDA1138216.1 DUF5615 family PIN-like protein [Planctomycetota bacterium]
MLRLLADENFNSSIVRGLILRQNLIDLVRVQDIGLSGAEDSLVLEVAADQDRLLLTHDFKTIPKHAFERIAAGLPMAGAVIGDLYIPTHLAIDDILLLTETSEDGEWHNQVLYLPL